MPGPAMPPGKILAGPTTAPRASATQTADHQRPGPGRRILSKIQAVISRTRALIPISTPMASCSADA